MANIFPNGTLVQYNEAWQKREILNQQEMRTHDLHIHVVLESNPLDDMSYNYELMCTEDGYISNVNSHETWLEPVCFREEK